MKLPKLDKRQKFLGAGILLVLVGVAVVVFAVGKEKTTTVTYEDQAVSKTAIERTLTAAGEVTPGESQWIAFSTSKKFKVMCVEENEAVIQGQHLAVYSDGTYLDAPVTGTVTAIAAPQTGAKGSDDNGITLGATDQLQLEITVPEDEIGEVTLGSQGEITVNADKTKSFSAVITRVSSISTAASATESGDEQSGQETAGFSQTGQTGSSGAYYKVLLSFANDGSLKLGMAADCTVVLEAKEEVIAVPIEAVYFTKKETPYVKVVASNGEATAVSVETGISDASNVEITSGLDGTETVRVAKLG